MTETKDVAAWADAKIHDLDANGWHEQERIVALSDAHGGKSITDKTLRARALLGARDRLLLGIEQLYRDALGFYPQLPESFDIREGLVGYGILDADHCWSPLGHELARRMWQNDAWGNDV